MTATNHALTGAIIGLLVVNPWAAIPLAIGSHFVCDAIPHFDTNTPNKIWLKSKTFHIVLLADFLLCVTLVLILATSHTQHWLIASISAFFATSPDLIWINQYRLVKAGRVWHPNLYSRFGGRIQWFQRPIGSVVEIAWFVGAVTILATIVH
jgi:hypothetical protein